MRIGDVDQPNVEHGLRGQVFIVHPGVNLSRQGFNACVKGVGGDNHDIRVRRSAPGQDEVDCVVDVQQVIAEPDIGAQ